MRSAHGLRCGHDGYGPQSGLDDKTVTGLAAAGGDERFADGYRRFIQMYGDVVLGVEHHNFETIWLMQGRARLFPGYGSNGGGLKTIAAAFKAKVENALGEPFPMDHEQQCRQRRLRQLDERSCKNLSGSTIFLRWGRERAVHGVWQYGQHVGDGASVLRKPSTGENAFAASFL